MPIKLVSKCYFCYLPLIDIHKYIFSFIKFSFYCSIDLLRGNIDICVGPFWQKSSNEVIYSDSFYTDVFFLFVRDAKDDEFRHALVSPFDEYAWMAISVTLLLMIFVLRTIHNCEISRLKKKVECSIKSWVAQVCGSVYQTIIGCITLDLKSDKDISRNGRIVVLGFIVFSFVAITAYTTALAIQLFKRAVEYEFTSLDDISYSSDKIVCVYDKVSPALRDAHPELLEKNIKEMESRTALFDDIFDENGECDAIVESFFYYTNLLATNETECMDQDVKMIEAVFSLKVSIEVSPSLGDIGEALIIEMNKHLYIGVHDQLLDYHFLKLVDYIISDKAESNDIDEISRNLRRGRTRSRVASNSGSRASSGLALVDEDDDLKTYHVLKLVNVINKNHCEEFDENEKNEGDSYSIDDLSDAIIFALSCTFLGIIGYLLQTCWLASKKIKMTKNLNQIWTLKTWKKKMFACMMEESNPFNIIQFLSSCTDSHQSSMAFDDAVNALPDKTKLVNLFLDTILQNDIYVKKIIKLEKLSVVELFDIYHQDLDISLKNNFNSCNEDTLLNIEAFFNHKSPKMLLILKLLEREETYESEMSLYPQMSDDHNVHVSSKIKRAGGIEKDVCNNTPFKNNQTKELCNGDNDLLLEEEDNITPESYDTHISDSTFPVFDSRALTLSSKSV